MHHTRKYLQLVALPPGHAASARVFQFLGAKPGVEEEAARTTPNQAVRAACTEQNKESSLRNSSNIVMNGLLQRQKYYPLLLLLPIFP
mmetsp:Transcript_3753/g.5640  ORF Transcript_3753/g.5640 Transcript_3753/m.5640 type:complete len:88 (+) Transcript_3753:1394-1657(+)